ncbi:hypothetical protein ACGFNU_32810 [Spirillospora sp. NPDC048911]|uniref:hypothetical protein n=1 Tax=Spirillospora sp. NPDC048911 TaxID=3364527 RepID=UPI00371E4A3F
MPEIPGILRSPSLRLCVAAGAVALTAGACNTGGLTKPGATATVTASPPPNAGQIAAKARDAFAKVPNVRVRGKLKTDNGVASIDYSVRGKNSKGKLSGPFMGKKKSTTQFVIIGDKHYTKGGEINVGPPPPAGLLDKVKGKWTLIRGKDLGPMGSFMGSAMVFGPAGTSESLSLGPGRDLDGKPAHDITDGKGSHLWISSQGEPLPLAVTNDKSPGDRLDFAYGQAEKITAPTNVLDLSKQGFKIP